MIWAAFLVGFAGSLHCAAMCGPLVFSLHKSLDVKGLEPGVFLYHGGRISAYLVLVGLFSLIRIPSVLFETQQYLSIVAGILLLLIVFKNKISPVKKVLNVISVRLSSQMSKASGFKTGRMLTLGFLNGLLPCGLSYAAAALAIGQSTFSNSLMFMIIFGLGTLPMFLVGSVLQGRIPWMRIQKVNVFVKYALATTAVLLIIRGAGLGIPYLSPQMNADQAKVECCEH
ncbi:MAG: sulfite exporter TauE/SafE [Bacteroidia bacterium]|jgi:sulfite exporter TauE/SafE